MTQNIYLMSHSNINVFNLSGEMCIVTVAHEHLKNRKTRLNRGAEQKTGELLKARYV